MRRPRWTAFSLFVLATLAVAPARAQDESSKLTPGLKAADLAGGYEIVSGEKFGVPEPADRVKGSAVRFTEDRVVVMDKDSKEVYGATYSLEPGEAAAGEAATGAAASRIKMISKLAEAEAEEQVALGLIDKDGDKVRLIYALPRVEAPKEFKTKAGQLMFILKKKAS